MVVELARRDGGMPVGAGLLEKDFASERAPAERMASGSGVR
jgi:hypothetical protein